MRPFAGNALLASVTFGLLVHSACAGPVETAKSAAGDVADICSLSYLDKCGQDIFLWRLDEQWKASAPGNADELKAHCGRQATSEDCVRRRSDKCHSSVVKGFSRLLYDAIHNEYEQRCDPESDLYQQYLKVAPCVDSLSNKMVNCTVDFILATDVASKSANGKSLRENIPRACCAYASYEHCIVDGARQKCDADTAAFVQSYMEATAGELLSFACASYTADDEVCQKHHKARPVYSDVIKAAEETGIRSMLGALSKLSGSLQANRG